MVSKHLQKVFLLAVLWIFILNTLNVITRFFIFDRTSYEPLYATKSFLYQVFAPWLNFDGLNYLKIVTHGYDSSNAVFFPLFPASVYLFSFFGLIDPVIAGLIFTNLAAFLCVFLFFNLVKSDYSKSVASKSVLLILLFPTSFYLVAYYTESLFLCLTLLTFLFLQKKQYLFASFAVLLATATRIFGLALIVPLAYEAHKFYIERGKYPFWVLVSPLGLIIYSFYSFVKFDNPFLMITTQESERFSRDLGFFSPIQVFMNAMQKILSGPSALYDSPFVYPVILIEFAAIIFALIMLIITYRKIAFSYWVYCLSFVLIILYSGGLSSDLRYLLMLFPFFIYLALKLNKYSLIIWCVSSCFLMLLLATLFLRNYWVG